MDEKIRLKILFAEDMIADFELAESELVKNEIIFTSLRVENSSAFEKALYEFKPDIIISDYSMPQFNGMFALKIAKEYDPLFPFIIVTGTLNEEIAVNCIKAGANDYVIKEHIGKLPFAVNESLRYRDVMKEKLSAEKALLESESRYRNMFENNYTVMLLVDPEDGSIIDVNPAASEFYGYPRKDFRCKKLSEISAASEETINERLDRALACNKDHFITKHIIKKGFKHDVEVFGSPVNYSGKKLILFIIQDVTERNRAMALVHEKLYKSKNMSKLDLKDYLTDLIDNIFSAYGVSDDRIVINNEMTGFEVLIDAAIPCGLVVNELISNGVKHAFPGSRTGQMCLNLSMDKNDEIMLIVEDDGIGKDLHSDPEFSESMGLQIVKNIVEYQMKGSIILDRSSGTKWQIVFRDNIYEERV